MSTKAFEVLSIEEMNKLESPGWLVHEAIPAHSLIQIFGRESNGKTFVALDMALRIASGLPWMGERVVHQGKVVYVAGEGITGLKKRVAAWQHHMGVSIERLKNFWVVPEPVQLAEEPHVAGIVRSIEAVTGSRACDLVVFDTQARCTAGVDENSAEEMGVVVGALDWLRLETGAAIMLIHHSPYNVERGRGSSVIPGALDTVIGVAKKGHIITLTCRKQKDWEEFEEFKLGILPTVDSAVVIEMRDSTPENAALAKELLSDREHSFLTSLSEKETFKTSEGLEIWVGAPAPFFKTMAKFKKLNMIEQIRKGEYRVLFDPSTADGLGKS
jgi:hypothetical protein